MFWIAWCYFGLSIVHISDAQRRAVVNYSYTTSKPVPSPTTASPARSTTSAIEETSINSISKLPTTESIIRGSSRDASASVASTPLRGPPKNKEEPRLTSDHKASILSASSVEESDEDRIYARRVFPPGTENRPLEKDESIDRNRNPSNSEPVPRLDISPTKAYDSDVKSGSSRVEEPPPRVEERPDFLPREEARTSSRDREKSELPRRDDIQSSRRSEAETPYREPDYDREYPRRYATNSDGGRSRYDDFDDRGSRGRYDERDRGRQGDDRYSKGDTRVYPDDRDLPVKSPPSDDRNRARERYPEDVSKRGDDERYYDRDRDYEERRRTGNRDTRDRDRDLDDRSPLRDDRYKDDDRYRPRDDPRYRDRDDERDKSRDDDRIRSRDGDDRYVYRDEDRYRSRDDDRYRTRDDDDRYRPRDEDRYRGREEDRYRARDDDRYRTREDRYPAERKDVLIRPRDEKDEYRPRVDDARYMDSSTSRLRDTESVSRSISSLPVDRVISSSRSEYDKRVEERVTDYENPVRDRSRSYLEDVNPSRLLRPPYEEEKYRDRDRDDDYRRPSRYEDEVRSISPTKTRDNESFSRSSLIDSRSRDDKGSRYTDSERDRIRDDRYYDQDSRIRGTRIQDSRSPASAVENSRRFSDDDDRYRTRLPNERVDDPKISERREEVVLDRRSYASERDEEYRRRGSKTDEMYDRDRRPIDETRRRYGDDVSYSRRDIMDDEDYKRSRTRDDYDRDRSRSRDRYGDEPRRQVDTYPSKDDKPPPYLERKYDPYPDEDERSRRRNYEISTMRKDDSRDREENLRPSSSSRDEERSYSRDEYPDSKSSSRRRYGDDDVSSLPNSRDFRDGYSDDSRYPRGSRQPAKEPTLGSSRPPTIDSREPSDIVIREKRFQSSDSKQQASRVYGNDDSKAREQVRPLSAKDVIEAAIRHSDSEDQNSRKVFYPVFDPRMANLTSTELIRPGERRGTTITAKKRRSV